MREHKIQILSKSIKPYFKYFRSQVQNSVAYSVQAIEVTPVDLLHLHLWRRPRERPFQKQDYCVIECFAVLFPPASQQGQFVANYYNANSLKRSYGRERWFSLTKSPRCFLSIHVITPMCSEAPRHVHPELTTRNWCGFTFVPFRSRCCLGSFASVCQLSPPKSHFPYLVILWLQSCSSASCHLILMSVCSSSSFEWNHTHKAINLTSPSKLCSTVSSAAFTETF